MQLIQNNIPILTKSNLPQFNRWLASAKNDGAFILIDKEVGPTSFDVVYAVRKKLQIKKVGHAGTLDPLASGLLIIACGKATKSIDQFQGLPKGYSFTIKLGATTKTDDAQMPEENLKDIGFITEKDVSHITKDFIGCIAQTPPIYSAIKINGSRAYDLARQEQTVVLQSRPVMIYQLKITHIEVPFVSFELWCSKGTYVRSLARDIGEKLGCGAYVTTLRRIAIGLYEVDDAISVNDIPSC